jgi:hypothetical protein
MAERSQTAFDARGLLLLRVKRPFSYDLLGLSAD